MRRLWRVLLCILNNTLHRLKRVPTLPMTFFRWIFAVTVGPPTTENPHYARLRAKQERGECLNLEDVNRIVVPLLVERGKEIQRWRIENLVLYVFVFIALCVGAFFVQKFLTQTRDIADKNTQAIFVGCTVTANVVVRSGAPVSRANGGPSGRPVPPSAQQQLSALRVKTIHSLMAPATRAEEAKLLGEIARAGGLEVPNCKKIAEHPESVKAYTPNPTRATSP